MTCPLPRHGAPDFRHGWHERALLWAGVAPGVAPVIDINLTEAA